FWVVWWVMPLKTAWVKPRVWKSRFSWIMAKLVWWPRKPTFLCPQVSVYVCLAVTAQLVWCPCNQGPKALCIKNPANGRVFLYLLIEPVLGALALQQGFLALQPPTVARQIPALPQDSMA